MHPITKPTLLLDEDIAHANIKRMSQKAQKHNLTFKPHMKTHQSAHIGDWFKAEGVEAITVSSVTMANYFAENGWSDITIAFPVNLTEIETINDLAEKVRLTLLVNSTFTAQQLQKKLTADVDCYIEIDTGSKRTGIPTEDISTINQLLNVLKGVDKLSWKGFYSHPGHSYNARSMEEIQNIHQTVAWKIKQLRSIVSDSTSSYEVCIGDTPCCSKCTNFDSIDAISPGNFVFYDLMQYQIGSCKVSDIATAVTCPIVDRYPDRNQIAIYGGAIHFSKEVLETINGLKHYGWIAEKENNGWKIMDNDTYLMKLSQEHGIIQCSDTTFDRFAIGDTLMVLPVHSCLTANLLGRYRLLKSQEEIISFS
ncbi:alanine racemase [Aliifodinibius salicampi]|uniref:Alanine racemase n=1 Tax=Fodinibius salicampi TaxID=1920655 RepID=A0ABT3PV91_9BACT|nr:alanine racemase [Fodinibius salicampi]MCW9711775.1 alanine racemase [Fodinibius salicampi]